MINDIITEGCKEYVQSHHLFKSLGKKLYEKYQALGLERLVGRIIKPPSKIGYRYLGDKDSKMDPPITSQLCPKCNTELLRRSLSNRIKCLCSHEFCWHCGIPWGDVCKQAHIIG